MIETTGLSAPQGLQKINQGQWGEIFLDGNQQAGRVLKAIYKEDSNIEKLNQVRAGAKAQNQFPKAPKVYSVGLRNDGRIWIEMDYLQGYKNIEDVSCDREVILSLIEELKTSNISHREINSRNIMTNGTDCMLVDFDDATEYEPNSDDANLITRIANFYGK